MADDTAALLRQLGIKEADFVGYSMGAGIALEIAIQHPDLVRKLVVAAVTYNRERVTRGEATMRRNLRPEDVTRLLAAPKCATLATYRRDGTVLLSPVWHEWRGGGFGVHLGADGINVRLLRRDPRTSIVVYDDAPPYAGVELRGEGRLTTEDERGTLRRLAVRYLGEREGHAYADAATWVGVVLRLEPGELRIWDFVDEFGEPRTTA